jgi:hypothetical protein
VRTGAPAFSLVPSLTTAAPAPTPAQTAAYKDFSVDQILQLSALRLRLKLLGASPSDVDEAVAIARDEIRQGAQPPKEMAPAVAEIKAAATKAKGLLPSAAAGSADGQNVAPPAPGGIEALARDISQIEQRYGYLATLIQGSSRIDGAAVTNFIKSDATKIYQYISASQSGLQGKYPDLFQAVVELHTRLDVSFLKLEPARWYTSDNFLEQFDDAIQLQTGSPEKSSADAETAKPTMRKAPLHPALAK